MRFGGILLAALLAASPVAAQVMPMLGMGDPRLQSMDFRPDQVIRLTGAVGYQITVELAPDETVRSIALGDSSAWAASTDRGGNRLFLKALLADVATNMTVITDVRTYAFDLQGTADAGMTSPYLVRFRYPSVVANTSGDPVMGEMTGSYLLRGDRALRPVAISDDGIHTYIEWPADALLPATYVGQADGSETLANGQMRGRYYVLDSVDTNLIFRLDKRVAKAKRQVIRSK
ncbi:TrbG/VirB9 family P-type conjugative transfer protein [Sphingomonas panni]|uniref:TrbG/VirB9 family P-type conjugative transfer protein n=1 Tax=Sphingomonas panni TaxID=237612 RepID=UPI001F5B8AC0|nr:TrbG/VirB9 family P-type conjugative transfer protein [Sphingomonas panni]